MSMSTSSQNIRVISFPWWIVTQTCGYRSLWGGAGRITTIYKYHGTLGFFVLVTQLLHLSVDSSHENQLSLGTTYWGLLLLVS